MIDEPFASGNSLLHRLDPRLKLVFTALWAFVVALSSGFPTLVAAFSISVFLPFIARLNAKEVFKRVAAVNGLVVFFWIVVPFTYEGSALFHIGPFTASREGVVLCAQITLKSNAILSAFIAMIATSSLAVIGHALHHLHAPDKIVHLTLLSYRYAFVIEQEYHRLLRAIKMRGFIPKTNMHTYRTYAYLVGMLLVRAFAHAERVQQAMLCRGFQGKFYCLRHFQFSNRDLVAIAPMAALLIGLVSIEWITTV